MTILLIIPCSPNSLTLDEPTNHLDVEALGMALTKFKVPSTIIVMLLKLGIRIAQIASRRGMT